MQFSILAVATLLLAPLAAVAAPAPEPVGLPEPFAAPDTLEVRDIVKRGYCSNDSQCNGKKCLCQACFGGPLVCYKICCS
ncbi:hypothetical protein ABW19_dt0207949 [Dactylella cylindrospora]|nr:hypothetical protein ABW19_dt0207949 [Dactylella cylindrospora]